MAESVEMQGIEFEIIGDSSNAIDGLDKLTKSLKDLKAVASRGLGLTKAAESIKNITGNSAGLAGIHSTLEKIAGLNFSNLSEAASSLKSLIGSVTSKKFADNASGADGMKLPTEESGTEHVESTTQEMKELPKAAEDAKNGVDEVKNSVKNAAKWFGAFKQTIVNAKQALKKGAVDAVKFGAKLAAMPFKAVASRIKSVLAPLQKFVSSLGRIAMYRAVRSILSGITSALKEGIKNLYEYSRVVGTTFHQSMNLFATDMLWLKNSFAAAVAPLIEMFMPALDLLSTKIADISNRIAEFFAAISGRSSYSKAVKYATEYADATGDAAKQVRMLISGFDELNVFPDQNDSSKNSLDYSSMFEEADVDSGIKGLVNGIKNAITTGDWDSLGKILASKVNGFIDGIDFYKSGEKLGKKVQAVVQTAFSFLKNVDVKNIGKKIANWFSGLFKNINFTTVGRLFIRKFTALFDLIVGFINNLDVDIVAISIGNFFEGAFLEASEWLADTDFSDLGKNFNRAVTTILQRIRDAVKTMDWYSVGKSIGDFLSEIDWWTIFTTVADIVWTAFSGTVTGLFSTDGGKLFLGLLAAVKLLPTVFSITQPLFTTAVTTFVSTGTAPLSGLATGASAAFTQTLGVITQWLPVIALAGADIAVALYDVKTISDAAKEYNEAQLAFNRETETALNSYTKLYNDKGKEVADEWAKMCYNIDLTGADFKQSQELLTYKIEGLWSDVPKNIWDGLAQGLDYYFGDNGKGLFALIGDGFSGAVSAVKNLLGIASPSKVFKEIGINMDKGLLEGLDGGKNALLSTATQLAGAVSAAATPDIPSPSALASSFTQGGTSYDPQTYYDYYESDDDNSDVDSLLQQILEYLKSRGDSGNDVNVIIDGREVFNAVVNENNRAIQRTGVSPIRV